MDGAKCARRAWRAATCHVAYLSVTKTRLYIGLPYPRFMMRERVSNFAAMRERLLLGADCRFASLWLPGRLRRIFRSERGRLLLLRFAGLPMPLRSVVGLFLLLLDGLGRFAVGVGLRPDRGNEEESGQQRHVCTSLRYRWTLMRIPAPMKSVRRAVPPYDRNGSGTPTTGRMPDTMPMLTKA